VVATVTLVPRFGLHGLAMMGTGADALGGSARIACWHVDAAANGAAAN